MGKVVSILHYSALPIIGGVELTIDIHARLLKENNFKVNIIAGDGKPDKLIPELKSSYYNEMLKKILKGKTPDNFDSEVQKLKEKILKKLKGTDILIVHNLFTMHFDLVATAALIEISKKVKTIAWVHDLSYVDPTYVLPSPGNSPLKLISNPAPNIKWVTITNYRRELISRFFGLKKEEITVIHNGIDPYKILPPDIKKTAKKLKIFSYYPVAIFPSRLTRRKNFELAIDIMAGFKGNPLLLLSAPPDPHNPDFSAYKKELNSRAKEKGVSLILFSEHCPIKDIETFYFLGDFLLITSTMEGFGLPALEASLFRLPAVVSNIPALKEVKKHFKSHIFFDLNEKPKKIAKKIAIFLKNSEIIQDRRMIIEKYSWSAIVKKEIKPLLDSI
jgi:glycosyltransferase involved in cell wall biosynthesis